MKNQLVKFKKLLLDIDSKFVLAFGLVEEIRSYYKYQNEETDSISEDLIVGFCNCNEVCHLIDNIDDLIEYEEDLELE